MDTKSNKMFLTKRKAIAGMLATGAGLSINFATPPFSFAASRSPSATNPTPLSITHVSSGTYAFGAQTTTAEYMDTINTSGDVTLYQQLDRNDIPRDAFYAGLG
ncbi:hypothetical protein KSF_105400 [Reticulibacter mediterranei]|uniref:Uncharacterized protein n=1 Tax=Reticulibacter mediterranei TaxID=2778369 RepID=A0A8J3N6M2_9CHLR|nr:hypothetical protein [Reticulibacter mediterranei]GHP00493.1 hypothetical protein KSF_105400 [Reticulibacter mediterranei]